MAPSLCGCLMMTPELSVEATSVRSALKNVRMKDNCLICIAYGDHHYVVCVVGIILMLHLLIHYSLYGEFSCHIMS